MKGFEFESSTRSSLGWEMIRLLDEVNKKPEYIIFENVAMITSKKFNDTLELFKSDLKKKGYIVYEKVLSATDYEIPQTRARYFLVAILNKNKKFCFPTKKELKYKFYDFLEKNVDEKYYLTDSNYSVITNGNLEFINKKNDNIIYEINKERYLNGGICGKDKHTNFAISSRIFSPFGNAPTLTACNTADNCKIIVESEDE